LYPSTLGLGVELITRPVGVRPLLRILESAHPLAVEARDGISQARLEEIAAYCAHARP
jgi:hypothetical protein